MAIPNIVDAPYVYRTLLSVPACHTQAISSEFELEMKPTWKRWLPRRTSGDLHVTVTRSDTEGEIGSVTVTP